jgi:hypothetical protein
VAAEPGENKKVTKKLLHQSFEIQNTFLRALKRITKLTAFGSVVALGVVPLFAQNSDNEPAARPGEKGKDPVTETSKGEAPAVGQVDARADRLLRAMGDYLKAAKEFSFHAEIKFDDVQASGGKIQFGATNDISVRRPVRAVKSAEVGKRGTVMKVFDNVVVVDCTLKEHSAPVLAQMWDVLPERLWDRLLKRRKVGSPITAGPRAPGPR